MVRVCVRRNSDSQYSRAIYEAIKAVCYQKQCPNEERILRFVLREFDWKAVDVSKQLRFAVEDGLFRETVAISHKGSKKGNEQMSYRIINTSTELDVNCNSKSERKEDLDSGHDWYCFDCQESGEVILCEFCPRVFHRKCAKAHYISQEEKWKCPSCKAGEENDSMSSLPKERIARMLDFTVKRLKEKFSELTKHVSIEHCPDYNLYINHPTDLGNIETEVLEEKFLSPGHFLQELKYLLHNAIIYFGDDDEITVMAEELIEDAKQEIEEMLLCPDCYFLSNSRPKDWFCQPCNPPHELVWAQMKSQPPWPAKVLKWNEDKTKALVRFFEARHQRAWVYYRNISPITSKPDVKKRPRSWLDGQQELQKYQTELRKAGFDVKPKIELMDEDASTSTDDSLTSISGEVESCFASVSCQTDEDPNKTVIDKLRKRIDDLEQDLRETKEKLNFQQQNKDLSSCIVTENGGFLNNDSKRTVKKLIASFEETLQQNGNEHERIVAANSEKELSFERKISKLKSQWQLDKQNEMKKLKAELQVKHDQELQTEREKENVQRKQFAENLKRIAAEQKRQEIEDAKDMLQRHHQQELDDIRNVFEQNRREIEERSNNLQRQHVAGVNELRAVFEQRRQRELEETKSSLVRCHEMEINELRAAMNRERETVILELKREQERVLRDTIRSAKRKQWCCNCQEEASYPCCWNTSYCSRHCQHMHWNQHRLHCSRNLVYVPNTRPAGNLAKI